MGTRTKSNDDEMLSLLYDAILALIQATIQVIVQGNYEIVNDLVCNNYNYPQLKNLNRQINNYY